MFPGPANKELDYSIGTHKGNVYMYPMGNGSHQPAPLWFPLHGLQLQPRVCSRRGFPLAAASFRPDLSASLWAPPWAAAWGSALLCCTAVLFPFFNLLSQRDNQHCSLAWFWPEAGPIWSHLVMAFI